jgi:hypothetical protein
MCVIAVVDNPLARPTDEEVAAMWRQNPQGGGVAWQEDGKVNFRKGLLLMEMQKFIRELPTPFIAHFRISSTGDKGLAILTHPFLIEDGSPLSMGGSTESSVLFHNGHWNGWETQSRVWQAQARIKVKAGEKWSDSRAMAFWAHHFGTSIFSGESPFGVIQEKIVLLHKEGEPEFFGTWGWQEHNGYIISNDYWITRKTEPHLIGKTTAPAQVSVDTPTRWVSEAKAEPKEPKEGVKPVEVHPFQLALEAHRRAFENYHSRHVNGERKGSKSALKKARKLLDRMRAKYPAEAKSSDIRDSLQTREQLVSLIDRGLNDLGGPPQILH